MQLARSSRTARRCVAKLKFICYGEMNKIISLNCSKRLGVLKYADIRDDSRYNDDKLILIKIILVYRNIIDYFLSHHSPGLRISFFKFFSVIKQ